MKNKPKSGWKMRVPYVGIIALKLIELLTQIGIQDLDEGWKY